MVTIAVYWIAASYVLAIAIVADQLRRPLSDWQAAGRERRFWVALTAIMGFHGLGPYAAVAYFVDVVPRFGRAGRPGPGHTLWRRSVAISKRMWRPPAVAAVPEGMTATRDLALVAAFLVFGSSLIHAGVTGDHFRHYWLFGVCFAVTSCLQAAWSALMYRNPLNRRLLVAGLAGNAALVVVWLISRTVGMPVGPDAWQPERVGEVDVISTLDEVGAVVLIAAVLAAPSRARTSEGATRRRTAAMFAGPLVLYSFLAAFGGDAAHH